jgi:hypothetical protein
MLAPASNSVKATPTLSELCIFLPTSTAAGEIVAEPMIFNRTHLILHSYGDTRGNFSKFCSNPVYRSGLGESATRRGEFREKIAILLIR